MRLDALFKHRDCWLGFAIVLVVLFHVGHVGFLADSPSFQLLRVFGVGGVDIFVFASGVGCYYSLDNNPDALEFIKRRARRLLPTWLVFFPIWWATLAFQGRDLPFTAFVGNLLCVQTFIDWSLAFNWYVGAIWFLYLLAPYFHLAARRIPSTKIFLAGELGLLALTISCWFNAFLILAARLPIFFAGFYVARLARDGRVLSSSDRLGLILSTAIGTIVFVLVVLRLPELLLPYGLWWYPFVLITPGLCFGLSMVCARVESIGKILSTLGKLSFELFLVHYMLINIIEHQTAIGVLTLDGIGWLSFVVLSIVGAVALRTLTGKIFNREAIG